MLHIGPLNCIKLSIKLHIVFFASKSVAGQGRSLSLEYLHNWIFFSLLLFHLIQRRLPEAKI